MIRKILITVFAFLIVSGGVSAMQLWEYGSFQERAEMATESGIVSSFEDYEGTYEQNIGLLSYLEGSNLLIGAVQRPSGYKTTLAESLNATASTTEDIKVSSLNTKDGHTLTTADVGSYIILTIAPGRGNEEKLACTGGTDSVSNWLDCTRGLNYYNQSTGDATVYTHSPGETVIISDDDAYVSIQLGLLGGDNTWTGTNIWTQVNTFNQYPEILSSLGTATTTWQLITKGYADNLVNQGAATSTETVSGISELATYQENASSTPWGLFFPHVQQSEHSSSTPSANVATTNDGVWDIWSDNTGKLSQLWLDLTEAFTFSGDNTFSGNRLVIGGNASSTALWDFAGDVNFTGGVTGVNYLATSTVATTTVANTDAWADLFRYTVLGGALKDNSMIDCRIWIDSFTSNTANFKVNLKYGDTTSTELTIGQVGVIDVNGFIDIALQSSADGSQFGSLYVTSTSTHTTFGTTYEDTTIDRDLVVAVKWASAEAADSIQTRNAYCKIND